MKRSKAARERLALRIAPWLGRRYWQGVYDGTVAGIASEAPEASPDAAWVTYTATTVANQLDQRISVRNGR